MATKTNLGTPASIKALKESVMLRHRLACSVRAELNRMGQMTPTVAPSRRHGSRGGTTQRRAQFADGQRRLTIDSGRLAREGASYILDPAGVSTILRSQNPVPEGEIEPEVLVLMVMVNRMVGWTNNPSS